MRLISNQNFKNTINTNQSPNFRAGEIITRNTDRWNVATHGHDMFIGMVESAVKKTNEMLAKTPEHPLNKFLRDINLPNKRIQVVFHEDGIAYGPSVKHFHAKSPDFKDALHEELVTLESPEYYEKGGVSLVNQIANSLDLLMKKIIM